MIVGMDIGGTKIELAEFDNKMNLVSTQRVKTPTDDYRAFMRVIASLVPRADTEAGTARSLGICLPGVFDAEGRASAACIPCLNGQRVKQDLEDLFARPLAVENDVSAFVYSEANGGAGGGYAQVLGVVLGTGVGGGLCKNGEIYRSRQRAAFEFGHLPMPSSVMSRYQFAVRDCGCGARGCFNEYLSGRGLAWIGQQFGLAGISAEELVARADEGEALAVTAFDAFIDCLGAFLAQLTLLYDPDVVVLGGGLSKVQAIYECCPDAVKRHLMAGITPPPVVPPVFGDASGVRGAAMLGHRLHEALLA